MNVRMNDMLFGKLFVSNKKGGVKIKPLHHFCSVNKGGQNHMVFYSPKISKFVTDMEKIVGGDTQYTDNADMIDVNLYELCSMIYDDISLEV